MSTALAVGDTLLLLATERPVVLVSDTGMPDEDRYALIEQIRSLPAAAGGRPPAIALTAYARSQYRVKAVLAGFQHQLAKRAEPAELIAIVASLLDDRRT